MAAVLAAVAVPSAGVVRADERPDAGGNEVAPRAVVAAAGGHVLPADLEDVEHMCALLTACDRLPLPAGMVPREFASCTRALYSELASASSVSFSLTLRDCGLRASSCGELRACALRGAHAEVCAGRGKTGPVDMCDGDGRAITCNGEHVTLVRDCPRGGEQCVVMDGHAACALGSCEKDGPAACSVSGTRVLECKRGKLLSLDCGAFGLRCAPSGEGPRCATQAASCQEGAARCEGASSVSCWHGHEVRVDCGARGLGCAVGASGADGGPGSGAANASLVVGACAVAAPRPVDAGPGAPGGCDPAAPPRCEGATVRWCAWGQPRGYLCKSVGLQRCVTDEKGAHCAP